MGESTENGLHTMEPDSGCTAAAELSSLIEQVKKHSDAENDLRRLQAMNADLDRQAIWQISWQRQAFASTGVVVDDEEIISFYLSTRTLEAEQILRVIKNVGVQIGQFQALGDADFSYSDWQSVQALERNFLEFGLTFDNAELFELYRSDTAEVFTIFRAKIHAGVMKMLEVISQEGEYLPDWLETVLAAEPGAEKIILADTDERQAYKQLLMTFFDSLGLTNRRYLVEQVLDSWTHR
ncbi:MAG: hypothetical protein P4L53_19460 [Candidatus Obscuribacterales bacterium]|nr:hypothetical protein [Candidatus Obscuribacterales bacterium]